MVSETFTFVSEPSLARRHSGEKRLLKSRANAHVARWKQEQIYPCKPAKLVGPFDQRKLRFRCERCTRSHLKCSGSNPCQNCIRKQLPCTYVLVTNPVFKANKSRALTISRLGGHGGTLSRSLIDVQAVSIVSFFDNFVSRGHFADDDCGRFIKSCLHDLDALYFTVFAIGALNHVREGYSKDQDLVVQALQAYEQACKSMRKELVSASEQNWVVIAETTMMMGLFELMYSTDSLGWRQHFECGTRQLFQKMGPEACYSGEGQRVFLKFRILEIMSTILFASRSFLASEPWLAVLESIRQQRKDQKNLKEDILDLATICSDLCLLATESAFLFSKKAASMQVASLELLATEGLQMRQLLDSWKCTAETTTDLSTTHAGKIVAWSMYHCISIYLHTSFAVNPCWDQLSIEIPILKETELKEHLEALIAVTSAGLLCTEVSPPIFVLPLCVAGGIASSKRHRTQIMNLLNQMKEQYGCAHIPIQQVSRCWAITGDGSGSTTVDLILRHQKYSLLGLLKADGFVERTEEVMM